MLQSVNYLHYGRALDFLKNATDDLYDYNIKTKNELIEYIKTKKLKKNQIAEIEDITNHQSSGNSLNLEELITNIKNSIEWRKVFRKLNCRGFSFDVIENPKFNGLFSKAINLRFALVFNYSSYYPPKVRDGLNKVYKRSWKKIHIINSIGWIHGSREKIKNRKVWILKNIQTDLMSMKINAARQIFRGWERLLFFLILKEAQKRNVDKIYIPAARSIKRTYCKHSSFKNVSGSLTGLYDGTAEYFRLNYLNDCPSTNIQVNYRRKKVICSEFYVGGTKAILNLNKDTGVGF